LPQTAGSTMHSDMETVTHGNTPRVIVVCGPTGIGKTRTAIHLAQRFGGEIIGADSMQIYRHMDIGTAKPTPDERSRARHHMVGIIDPDTPYDAARYARDAGETVRALHERGVVPVVAGGTGLYIKALIYGLFNSQPPDPDIRRNLEQRADAHGTAHLHEQLAICDPHAAAGIHVNDRFRIIRALETYQSTGRPISTHQQRHRFARPRFAAFKIGLTMPRADLYARIDQRVDQMVAEGLLEEVRGLLGRGYGPELKSMQSIGYRHMVDYLHNRVDWDETLRLLKRDTRRYAKRQFTWFRADPDIEWITPDELESLQPAIKSFLTTGPPVLKTQRKPNGNL
jgi:tRNA dimethylallyltransferase